MVRPAKSGIPGRQWFWRIPPAVMPLMFALASPSWANQNGIFDTYTGGGAFSACSGCHTGSSSNLDNYQIRLYKNSLTVANQLVNTSDTISKNVPTNFNVYLSGDNAASGGFNVHASTGSFTAGGDTLVGGTGNRQATHIDVNGIATNPGGKASPGGDVSWTFTYNPPNSVTTVTFSVCGNPADGDGTADAQDGPGDTGGVPICSVYQASIINNPPVADNESTSVNEDSTVNITKATLLVGDNDINGDSLSVSGFSQAGTTGSVTDNGAFFTYNPNGQFEALDSGESLGDSFTYTVSDGLATDTGTVNITVFGANDAPVANNDGGIGAGNGHVTINEGDAVVGVGSVLANDSDVDIEAIVASRAGPGCAAVSPSESVSFTLNANGTFDYTHDGSEPVQDSFSYCAFDGTAYSNVRTVYIDIAGVNDPPTISGFSGSVNFTEQTAVTIDDSISIADTDSTLLDRARITISGGYETGDTLDCGVTPGGISCGTFDVPSRTLTLSGTAGFTDYQSAIQGISFDNPVSDNPSLASRTIELDVRDDALGQSSDYAKTVTVTRANDAPTLAVIANQSAFEDTPADPFTFTVTAVASDVDVDDDINDGGLGTGGTPTLTYSLSGAPAGMTISNLNPSHGQISWNPPITGYPATVYGPITVLIEDGDEDVSAPNTVSFSITVSPPDDDSDNVENYNDLCLNVPDPTNADNDGDGVAGTDGGVNSGGDVCDLDDDNDGMPDSFEIAEGFDPFDASDAAQDADGDGISNLQEFLDGTNPNFANLVIDATGYLTPFDLPQPDPAIVHPQATTAEPDDPGPYRPGRNTIVWSGSNANNVLLGTSNQTLDIRPLVNFGPNQQAEEGAAVSVDVMLNGDPPSYPVTVNYSVSGTATNPADHDAVSGAVVFTAPSISETLVFNLAADLLVDGGETVVFTIDSATNAAIGSNNVHRVEIVENNVAPQVLLQFTQGGDVVGSAFAADGAIDIDALVTDINAGQSFSFDWSGTDAAFVNPGNVASWQVTPAAGNYRIDVIVTDDGVPARSTRFSRILNVNAGSAPALGGGDADGDGLNDNDPLEGYADDDGDGIPNYLDALNSSGSDDNLVPDQTVDINTSYLLQTETGLALARGNTAQAANRFGTLLTGSEISQFGGLNGGPPVNPDDSFAHVGGIYDFRISGLEPGSSARIVIPLLSAVPRNAVYRKFNPAIGWGSFVIDGNNSIATAPGELGACPEPGHASYREGLNYLDSCLQLTIQDGGPNDTDNALNGVVSDPGTIGVRFTEPEAEVVEDGGGRLSPQLMILFVLLALFSAWRRRDAFGK